MIPEIFLRGLLVLNGLGDFALTLVPGLGDGQCAAVFEPMLQGASVTTVSGATHLFKWNFLFHGVIRLYAGGKLTDDNAILVIASYFVEALQFALAVNSGLADFNEAKIPIFGPLFVIMLLLLRNRPEKNKKK